MGCYQDARQAFDEAIKIDPRDANYQAGRGHVLHVLERAADAREAVHTAMELDHPEAREALEEMSEEGH